MKKLFTILLLAFAAFSCTETLEPEAIPEATPSSVATATTYASSATTHTALPNPYSLTNMQAVYSAAGSNITLQPTDLYVRFLPQDSTQMSRLIDLGLELFDFPLDIELEEGEVYVDPTIPEGEITWQYTAVKPNFVFPAGIPYEILEQCYIPEEGETAGGTYASGIDVEAEAFERLGYDDVFEPVVPTYGGAKTLTGTIRVYDNEIDAYVPVKSVKIRCHRFLKWSTGWTDENGFYTMGSKFRAKRHYAIVFDNREGFDLWANYGPLARANHNMGWYNGEVKNEDIGSAAGTGRAWVWATVNNAAYDYYKMCGRTGIAKPPRNLKIWIAGWGNAAPMLRRVHDPVGLNGRSDWINFFVNSIAGIPLNFFLDVLKAVEPDITISNGSNDSERIYANVFHELSHASHFSNVGSAFWARYVSYIITYGAYGDGSGRNAELVGIGEMWAYAMEDVLLHEKYGSDELPDDYPGDTTDWIKPHIFWNLISDDVLTPRQIFSCLTSSVDTYAELAEEMYRQYPMNTTEISEAFTNNGIVNIPSPPPPFVFVTPTISRELVTRQTGNLVDLVFSVDNPQEGVTYQWENNGQVITTTTVPYVAFLSPFQAGTLRLAPPISITLRCRAVVAGVYSEWSNAVWGSVMSLTPVPYNPNPLF